MKSSSTLPQSQTEVSHKKYSSPLWLVLFVFALAVGPIVMAFLIGFATHPESRHAVTIMITIIVATFVFVWLLSVLCPPDKSTYLVGAPKEASDR